MKTLVATHPQGEYPIYIGSQLLAHADLLQQHVRSTQVMVITNETIAPLYLNKVLSALSNTPQCDVTILKDGEKNKNLDTFSIIIDTLAEKNHHRDTTLIALGGGVIGDMTGFAAACYHRGVHFIQIPTTLLSQVDASVGGKTGVNHPKGKNLIGAFHQPQAVVIDVDTLQTLPDRALRAGFAEIIKSALIQDENFFYWLKDNAQSILDLTPTPLVDAILRACTIKRDIVAEDEKEQGVRAHLNLGHTFGHAIEHNLGYGTWLHGEAVATGLLMAAHLSRSLGWLSPQAYADIDSLIAEAGLPRNLPPQIKCDKLLAAMKGDKKVLENKLRLILLQSIGQAVIRSDLSDEALIQAIEAFRSD